MMEAIATQADILAIEQQGLPVALNSTYALIQQAAMYHADKPALSFFLQTAHHRRPVTYSYRGLLENINRTANFFHSLGADKNSVIAYILPNLPETHFIIWGGQATGIVAAINPLLEAEAIADLLTAAGASILVTLAPFPGAEIWQKVAGILHKLPAVQHLVLVNLADQVKGVKGLFAARMQKKECSRLYGATGLRGVVPAHMTVHDFNSAIRGSCKTHLQNKRVFNAEDFSSFFCTGGTTGLPKIAMRRHKNELANVISTGLLMDDSVGPGKNIFCGLPLFHVNAVLVTGLLPFSRGAHVVLGTPQGYRGEGVISRFWEIVEYHKINFFSGVPTLYASLLDVPVGKRNIHSLEYGLCGAAPLPVEVFKTFQTRTGLKILEGYGLTEGTCVSSVNPPAGEIRVGSIGLRIPGQQMKAVCLNEAGEYLRDCAEGESGVLLIHGDNVFAGYRTAEHNQGLWIEDGNSIWLNTGDLGYQDKDGYFWLTGRKKELIIRGGHNIDPACIEEPLHQHPDVQLVAAVGRPDAHAGELPIAYVQLRVGAKTSAKKLLEFAQQHIAERAAVPKEVRIIPLIPLTSVGKIFKPELKMREIHSALTEALCAGGVPLIELNVVEDKQRRLQVHILLKDTQYAGVAHQILGQFSYGFEIHYVDAPVNQPVS